MRLGVDIGRVIIDGTSHPDGGDTAFFTGDHLRTPAMAGMFELLPGLVERFDGRAWLISKCGPRVQGRTLDWLAHHDFHARTGIPPDHVRFCLRRPDKAIHCAELGITHFIDDKADVHQAIAGLVPFRYLFGPGGSTPPGVTRVRTWREAADAVVATLPVDA